MYNTWDALKPEVVLMNVYDKLYTVVVDNMLATDREFEYKRQTFLCDVGNHPQVIDVSKYLTLDNEDFFQALFVGAFRRLPEMKEVANWEQHFSEPREVFQEKVLRKFAKSSVIAINHVYLDKNPYFKQKRGLRYKMLGVLYGLTDKSSLREFGKKMPQPIQKIIRKVFL